MPDINSNDEIETLHVLDKYKNHLEFLGYIIEEDGEFSIACRHVRRPTLRISKFGGDIGVLARIYYFFPKRFDNDPSPLYLYSNDLNSQFNFLKACIFPIEESGYGLCMDSVLEGGYSRRNFSIFLDNIEHDMHVFHNYLKTEYVFNNQEEPVE